MTQLVIVLAVAARVRKDIKRIYSERTHVTLMFHFEVNNCAPEHTNMLIQTSIELQKKKHSHINDTHSTVGAYSDMSYRVGRRERRVRGSLNSSFRHPTAARGQKAEDDRGR